MSDLRIVEISPIDRAEGSVAAPATGPLRWRIFRIPGPFIACVGILLLGLGQFASAVQKGEKVLRADTVVAQRFELMGADGKRAALLRTEGEGEVLLSFYGEDGSVRLDLGISPRGQHGLTLYDPKHRGHLQFYLNDKDGTPFVSMRNRGLVGPAIYFEVTEDGPHMIISETNRGSLTMAIEQGEPVIRLLGQDEANRKPGILLEVHDEGPEITLKGKNGVTRTNWRLLPDGSPAFYLAGDEGADKLLMTVNGNTPDIRLLGKNGVRRTNWTLLPDGSPAIFFADEKGDPRISMGVHKDGKAKILRLEP